MIEVAAALIIKDKKVLICKRKDGGNCALLWEFPGGKKEKDENYFECAIRECREELSIEIEPIKELCSLTYKYPNREVNLHFILSKIVSGEISCLVHDSIKWAYPSEFKNYSFCPADYEFFSSVNLEELI